MSVDLPEPVAPMMARVFPRSSLKDIWLSWFSGEPGYANDTSLNSTVPVSGADVTVPGTMSLTLSSTSFIRSAETCAEGNIMKIMTIIMKDMTT